MQESSHLNRPEDNFTEEELIATWNAFARNVQQEGKSSFYSTLIKHTPILKDNFEIDFQLDNVVQELDFNNAKADLLEYLRNELNNYSIQVNVVINTDQTEAKFVTNKDKFQLLAEKNPALKLLQKHFNLDIEY